MRLLAFAAITIVFACAAPAPQPAPASRPLPLSFTPDTQRIERVAEGVTRHFIYSGTGPWAINVLEVDRSACYSAVAVKGFAGAAGRKRTSQLLTELDSGATVIAGVNADFFAPNGTPTNAHVSRGIVITGPSRQPVLAFDTTGRPHITRLSALTATPGHYSELKGWNRPVANALTLFDANWGAATDSASDALEIVYDSDPQGSWIIAVDTLVTGVPIPRTGYVYVSRGTSRQTDPDVYRRVIGRKDPRFLNSQQWLAGMGIERPREVVGGRPILVKDSAIVPEVDTEGAAGFATSRHPRTAVGIANQGNRLLLLTVDGRQKPYSDGMTLRELANLMLAMGARDAINLDGGGSTTLVYRNPASKQLTIANRPSDPTGERAVGNALAIVKGCAAR